MKNDLLKSDGDYADLLRILKEQIRKARVRAALSANRELITLYWQIGREILARQSAERWGNKVIDRLAGDLKQAFPEMKGLSPRNLKYMRAFAEAWPDSQFVQQAAAQIFVVS
jgi:predicted nuclease of restriction endonuclease-like (RecB) superfamily